MQLKYIIPIWIICAGGPSYASPTGVILDIFDVQSGAFISTSKNAINSIMRDFNTRVQSALDVTGGVSADAFESHQKAYANRRILIEKVNEAYNNLGDYGWFVNRLSAATSLVDDVSIARKFGEDLKGIAGGVGSLKKASDELYDILKTEPGLVRVIGNDNPKDIIDILSNKDKTFRIAKILEEIKESGDDVEERSKRVWSVIRAYTQQAAALDYSKNLHAEWGMKMFIQDTIVKSWRDSGVINENNMSYFQETVEVYYTTKGIFRTTLHEDGARTAGSQYKLLNDAEIFNSSETTTVFLPEEKPAYNKIVIDTPTVRVACEPPPCPITPTPPTTPLTWAGQLSGAKGNQSGANTMITFDGAISASSVVNNQPVTIIPNTSSGISGTATAVPEDYRAGYQYTAWGEWNGNITASYPGMPTVSGITHGHWVLGNPTQDSASVRALGSATYTGQLRGDYVASNGVLTPSIIGGTMNMNVNFSSMMLGANLNITKNGSAWVNTSVNNVQIQSMPYNGANYFGFNGLNNGPGGSISSVVGTFYGPQAQEAGGSWQYATGNGENASGVFRAKR